MLKVAGNRKSCGKLWNLEKVAIPQLYCVPGGNSPVQLKKVSEEGHQLKLDRYCSLKVDCEGNGWSCYDPSVGAR